MGKQRGGGMRPVGRVAVVVFGGGEGKGRGDEANRKGGSGGGTVRGGRGCRYSRGQVVGGEGGATREQVESVLEGRWCMGSQLGASGCKGVECCVQAYDSHIHRACMTCQTLGHGGLLRVLPVY